MSQRQVLQGRAGVVRRLDGLAARRSGCGGVHRLSLPQCLSNIRRPGRSSCRWWRSWRPDPKTSRRCRTRVSLEPEPASPPITGLAPRTESPTPPPRSPARGALGEPQGGNGSSQKHPFFSAGLWGSGREGEASRWVWEVPDVTISIFIAHRQMSG